MDERDIYVPVGSCTRKDRQEVVIRWCRQAFGADSVKQRAMRLLEEAIEAAQAAGVEEPQALRVLTYVYGRPVGELGQELGGVGVTLLALAATAGLDADMEERKEIDRVLSKPIEHFRARNEAKNAVGLKA